MDFVRLAWGDTVKGIRSFKARAPALKPKSSSGSEFWSDGLDDHLTASGNLNQEVFPTAAFWLGFTV